MKSEAIRLFEEAIRKREVVRFYCCLTGWSVALIASLLLMLQIN